MEKELNKLQEEQLDDVSGGLRAAEVDCKNSPPKTIVGKAGGSRYALSKAESKAMTPVIEKRRRNMDGAIDSQAPSNNKKIFG